jgi:hypothetical protein
MDSPPDSLQCDLLNRLVISEVTMYSLHRSWLADVASLKTIASCLACTRENCMSTAATVAESVVTEQCPLLLTQL